MAQIKFGIIGCGTIAPYHAEAIEQVRGAKLVAVSDVVEKNAKKLAKRFGAAPYADHRAMLADADLQAVCVCVPSGLRVPIIEDCAAAGKHIFAEKPLEITTKRIDRILRAVDKAGVRLGCVFQSRFSDGALEVMKALESGRFGDLVLGDAYIKWFRSQQYYDSGAWRGTREVDGGGCLMNQGIHQIDLLLWFMGDVKTVRAQTALRAHTGLEVEDLACAMLEFKNGAMGVIQGSTACWPGQPARVEVHGTQGAAIIEDGELQFWQFAKKRARDKKIQAALGADAKLGSGASDPTSSLSCEGHRRQIQDFTTAILKDRAPFVDGREGRRAVALIEAIYKSANTGRAVRM